MKSAGGKSALLKDHTLVAAKIVTAAKAGDGATVASENLLWKKNADESARLLNAANPKHWPLDTLKSMMADALSDGIIAQFPAKLAGLRVPGCAETRRIGKQTDRKTLRIPAARMPTSRSIDQRKNPA